MCHFLAIQDREVAWGVSAGALRLTPLKLEGSDPELKLDDCLIDQHDRDVVLYRVDAVTLRALQAFRLLAVFEPLLALRTNQNIE